MPNQTRQELREDKKQLQFQIDHAYQELNYLRRYIALTRLLRRAEDDLTTASYDRTRVKKLRFLRDKLVDEMVEEIQLNEVLDDCEGNIEQELPFIAV